MAGDSLTPKQEKFAQVYVLTGNASEAYRQAYDVGENTKPESVWESASRTLADVKVASRVVALQEQAAKRHAVTVDSITREYEEARELALKEGQSAAAVSATTGKAKLHGLLTDRVVHDVTLRHEEWLETLK